MMLPMPRGQVQAGQGVGVLDQARRAAQCPLLLVHDRQAGQAVL